MIENDLLLSLMEGDVSDISFLGLSLSTADKKEVSAAVSHFSWMQTKDGQNFFKNRADILCRTNVGHPMKRNVDFLVRKP